MKLFISGIDEDIKLISFSEKGFGKGFAENINNYELIIPEKEFFRKFEDTYNDCINELIRDDDITGVFHPPYVGAKNYPSLSELFTMPEPQRMEIINTYFVFDILRFCVEEDSNIKYTKWYVKSFDSIFLSSDGIVIKGECVSTDKKI